MVFAQSTLLDFQPRATCPLRRGAHTRASLSCRGDLVLPYGRGVARGRSGEALLRGRQPVVLHGSSVARVKGVGSLPPGRRPLLRQANTPDASTTANFDFETAVLAAGFSFETYSEPSASRWERGSDGCDVAYTCDDFTRMLYAGVLEVTILEASNLPEENDTAEKLVSGAGSDAYVLGAIVEGSESSDLEQLEKKISNGVLSLSRSRHVARTSTVWGAPSSKANSKSGNAYRRTKEGPSHAWAEGGQFYLYVQDPSTAVLALTVMDEDTLSDDDILGACTVRLCEKLDIRAGKPLGWLKKGVHEWEGWLDLCSRPAKGKGGQIAAGAAAGAMVFGPAGAAVGGLAGALWEGSVQGKVKCHVRYFPLEKDDQRPRKEQRRISVSEGVDWGALAGVVGGLVAGGGGYKLCCFLQSTETGGSVGLYRSAAERRLVVAFRGTCAPADLLTDVNILQTGWTELAPDSREDADLLVHAGFRASLQSVSRRLKELIMAAVDGRPTEWEMMVTGHSLGGALATLFAVDMAEFGVDAGRGLPTAAPAEPWWGRITGSVLGTSGKGQAVQAAPRLKRLLLYTFGAPRVGDKRFNEHAEAVLAEASFYRVVNGDDLVARMPRSVASLGIEYAHCGRTVLLSGPAPPPDPAASGPQPTLPPAADDSPEPLDPALDPAPTDLAELTSPDRGEGVKIWVEGESDAALCPVRDVESFSTDPLQEGNLLGDAVLQVTDSFHQAKGASLQDTMASVAEAMRQFKSERLDELSAVQAATVLGIDAQFVARELDMLKAVRSGAALIHHLEPAYFNAMWGAAQGDNNSIVAYKEPWADLPEAEQVYLKQKLQMMEDLDMLQSTLVSDGQKEALQTLKRSINKYVKIAEETNGPYSTP